MSNPSLSSNNQTAKFKQQTSTNNNGDSTVPPIVGDDPKSSKRNSALFSFFKWFKQSSRESINNSSSSSSSDSSSNSSTSSCESLTSIKSNGTAASFSYLPASAYKNNASTQNKCIVPGPETDTYKARLKQRDKHRENDKDLTLRKKYNLFFNRDTLLRPPKKSEEEESTKSLPTRTNMPKEDTFLENSDIQVNHRRTNSESSKVKRAGAYLHVKGKRKAPQPPGHQSTTNSNKNTMSLKRNKKRLAPAPPPSNNNSSFQSSNKSEEVEVICNDSLKLDHGILKPANNKNTKDKKMELLENISSSSRSTVVEMEKPVSPRPWYKRTTSNRKTVVETDTKKTNSEYEPIEQYLSTNVVLKEASNKQDAIKNSNNNNKRKSGMSFLTNISELDREASEIIKRGEHHQKIQKLELQPESELPEFMRPRQVQDNKMDSWVSPKRRSARDLIAKFNAITNVTRVTVFGVSNSSKDNKKDLFGKQLSLEEKTSQSKKRQQESILESHKKHIEQIDNKKLKDLNVLMKSESASAIKTRPETPKSERKSWKCPKCNLENEYWRIICHVCSAIKPYFDDFAPSSITKPTNNDFLNAKQPMLDLKNSKIKLLKPASPNIDTRKPSLNSQTNFNQNVLERSKTQIGFSALANYNNLNQKVQKSISVDEQKANAESQQVIDKKEERERLKKMLIEMKNSLPKRKSNMLKQNSRSSIIVENEVEENENVKIDNKTENTKMDNQTELIEPTEKSQEEKVAEILIGCTKTIYENIKVKKTDNPKPIKISQSCQTSSAIKKLIPAGTVANLIKKEASKHNNYELMRPKDFENIYTDKNGASAARLYANLAQNDELSLFFNMPKFKDNFNLNVNNNNENKVNTDTIEINRLLRRLETAIAKGDLTEAAIFAKELAQLKVNCSVIRQKANEQQHRTNQHKNTEFQIEMFVEDKISHRGPFPIQVNELLTVAELKKQVEREFEIPVNVQRWILGKELATDDNATLKDHNITTERCPVFLYLVAPVENIQNSAKAEASTSKLPNAEKVSNTKLLTEIQNIDSKPKDSLQIVKPSTSKTEAPKIVEVIPKVVELPNSIKLEPIKVEEPKTERATAVKTTIVATMVAPAAIKSETKPVPELNTAKTISQLQNKLVENRRKSETKQQILINLPKQKVEEKPQTSTNEPKISEKLAPKAKTDENFDLDDKTLRPNAHILEWECHLCTLLNPIASNVCAVCATVRLIKTPLNKKSTKKKAPQPQPPQKLSSASSSTSNYLQLVNLDNTDLVENTEPFDCVVCFLEIPPKQGVTLRECLHQFCKLCLAHTIEYSDEAEVKCPYRDDDYSCNIALQDREIKALVTRTVYDQFLARSVAQAENKMDKSFHCKTPDCKGWCIYEDNVNEFKCPVCKLRNCLTCQAIHDGLNCKQYQEKMNQESDIDENAKRTKEMLEEMVSKGEALNCPTCKVILMKKWGCDWLRCSMCKTEICWVTRGPRWGPGGKGDTSGGCQCGVNNVKCHPQCNYCH